MSRSLLSSPLLRTFSRPAASRVVVLASRGTASTSFPPSSSTLALVRLFLPSPPVAHASPSLTPSFFAYHRGPSLELFSSDQQPSISPTPSSSTKQLVQEPRSEEGRSLERIYPSLRSRNTRSREISGYSSTMKSGTFPRSVEKASSFPFPSKRKSSPEEFPAHAPEHFELTSPSFSPRCSSLSLTQEEKTLSSSSQVEMEPFFSTPFIRREPSKSTSHKALSILQISLEPSMLQP